MTKITIDNQHVYRADGRVVPGVTGIIRAAGLMDAHGWNEYARARGSAAHKAVELYEQDDLDMASLDPVIAPYLDAWIAFKNQTGFKSETQEQLVFHPAYQYAGTLDMTGHIPGATVLVDIKTGAYQPWWALQTAAYNAVVKRRLRLSVELRNDGTYRMTEHTDKRDFQRFLACLTIAGTKSDWGIL